MQPINWTEADLKTIDYTLRTYIRHQIALRRWRAQRADYYESRDFYLGLESLAFHVSQLGDSLAHKFMRRYFRSILWDFKEQIYK